MVRISKFALTLLSATAVAVPAGAAGPPIAYAKEVGSGFSIFVTNPNATGTLKLYSGPAKNSLIVDMNPNLSGASMSWPSSQAERRASRSSAIAMRG